MDQFDDETHRTGRQQRQRQREGAHREQGEKAKQDRQR
jgi:hypothetical protein